MSRVRTITSIVRLKGRRVLLRCDLNASITNGKVSSDDLWKLKCALPTIRYLLKRQAAVILVSHRGRPRGYDHDLSLEPIVRVLAKELGRAIPLWRGSLSEMQNASRTMRPASIACLENIRFYKGEEGNDAHFAKELASLADLYVNDAFGNIHRRHASMVAITRYLPSYAGFLVQREVAALQHLLERAKRPIVAIVGGNKISTKIVLLKRLLRKVDYLLLGGALANNVLAAFDYDVGRSKIETDMLTWSKSLMSNKLKLPVDALVSSSLKARARTSAVGRVRTSELILDLGPDTIALYEQVIRTARTVIWNGPLGYFEDPRYAKATHALVAILMRSKAKAYVGGGETVKAVLMAKAEQRLHFVSTGGGAMLSLLEGRPCPALSALIK